MSGAISKAAESLVAEVEKVLHADLVALEQREASFVEQCAHQASLPEPNYSLPEFPNLQEDRYRQLQGECRLLENALRGWLEQVESFLAKIVDSLPPQLPSSSH